MLHAAIQNTISQSATAHMVLVFKGFCPKSTQAYPIKLTIQTAVIRLVGAYHLPLENRRLSKRRIAHMVSSIGIVSQSNENYADKGTTFFLHIKKKELKTVF